MTNGNGESLKLSKTTLIAIGLLIPILIFSASMGASLYDDHEKRIRHLEDTSADIRAMRQEIDRQGITINRLEEKIDALRAGDK